MSHKLNPEQQRAVNTLSGPLLVLAGAGTGKTRVVTIRIAELIRRRTPPERILAVTFTNKAAAEMQERIGDLLGKRLKERPQVSTFHSHCVRILRRHAPRLGYPAKFAIYARSDQESTARQVLREINVPGETLRPGDLLNFISSWKCRSIRPEQAAAEATSDKEHLASMAFRRYQRALKNAGAMDFDDLLICTEELFAAEPDVRRSEAGLFDHILVDEYQDTNGSQYRIVRALAGGHRNLCVVGDDDQSIYGWRGAEVEHILRFQRDWPDATVVRLEQNYRSTAAILDMANRLIAFNSKRHDKTLRAARPGGERPRIEQFKNETDEATSIVADIRRRLSQLRREPRDFAILFRTNEQPRAFETELRRAKLPYVLVGGMSFFDRKEVRDILAYLRVIESPDDEVAMLRIINNPPRGIGPKAVEALLAAAVKRGEPVWRVAQQAAQVPGLPGSAVTAIERFCALIKQFQQRLTREPLVDTARALISAIDYELELRSLYNDENEQQSRWEAVEEVVNALGAYAQRAKKKASLSEFLDDVALRGNEFENDKENRLKQNAIALMTLHSAKGLEFPEVYMVGMEEGLLPHRRSVDVEGDAIDEERRLCYVGVTRAQERLTLSMALTRMKWGKPRDTIPSRFLFELIGQAENARAAARSSKRPVKRAARIDGKSTTPSGAANGGRRPVRKKSAKKTAPPKRPRKR